MFSLKVSGPNCASDLHLLEISIQVQIAKFIFPRLEEWSLIETKQRHFKPDPHPQGTVQLMSECSALLGACGVVAKTLLYGEEWSELEFSKRDARSQTSAQRAAELRKRLKVPDLQALRNLKVRNSFEHIDERLDALKATHPDGPFVLLHTSRHQPDAPVVLKRFNPASMTLHYLGETFDLRACYDELLLVEKLTAAALKRPTGT